MAWNSHVSWLNMLDMMLFKIMQLDLEEHQISQWDTGFDPYSTGEQKMAQWWERSPPTNVAGLKSRRQRHMWVQVVVGSLLFSERFFSCMMAKKMVFGIEITEVQGAVLSWKGSGIAAIETNTPHPHLLQVL